MLNRLQHYFSSRIARQLLASFAVVSAVALIGSVLAGLTVKQVFDTQQKLSLTSYPMLVEAESFTDRVSLFVLEIEKLFSAENIPNSSNTKQEIELLKSNIGRSLTKLKKYKKLIELHSSTNTTITQLFQNADKLQHLLTELQPAQVTKFDTSHRRITKLIRRGVVLIKLIQHNSKVTDSTAVDEKIASIKNQYQILLYLAAQTTINKSLKQAVISQTKSVYHLRNISKTLSTIPQTSTRQLLAQNSSDILKELDNSSGLFFNLEKVKKTELTIKKLIRNHRELETKLRRLSRKLIMYSRAESDLALTNLQSKTKINLLLILATGVVMVVTIFSTIRFYVYPVLIKRLEDLSENTREVISGNYTTPISTKGSDEIAQMAIALADFREALSEKEKTLSELYKTKQFLELILNSIPDMVFVKDSDFRIVRANTQFLEAYPEYKRDNIIGYTTVEQYDPHEAEAFLQEDRNAFRYGHSETIEEILFPDGVIRTLATKKKKFITHDNTEFILGIARDITQMKLVEKRLIETNNELERFAYVASHDLKEPLRMVTNFTALLEKRYGDKLDERAKTYIDYASSSALRMQLLIDDLLEYARLNDKFEKYEIVDLNKLFKSISELLIERIDKNDATLSYQNLPKLYSSKIRLFTLFQNIISNAIKYRHQDRVPIVSIKAKEENDHTLIAIQDNGIGIKQEYQKRIFEPFKRLHRKEEYPGTGMGLAICKKIVESLGGTIEVQSEFGKSTTFLISLPIVTPQETTQRHDETD